MNPTTAQAVFGLYEDNMAPSVVHEVNDDLMYIGYCTPDCTGYDDPKWTIKRVERREVRTAEGGYEQTIFYANGNRRPVNRWSDHTKLTYMPNENWK